MNIYLWFLVYGILAIGVSATSSEEDDDSDSNEVDDDDRIVIGDMRLRRGNSSMQSRAGADAINQNGHSWGIIWAKNTIPYVFEDGIDPEKKPMIISAMNDIMKAVPNCWKFVPKTNEKHWVIFKTSEGGCNSAVGNEEVFGRGPQETNFGADFCKHGSMVHELLHTVGFMHEFTRNDRDEYIDVFFDRIPKEDQHNFIIDSELPPMYYSTDYYDVAYNFESVMHYAFRLSGMIKNPVMKNKKNPKAIGYNAPDKSVGQRYKLSKGDLLMIARRGKCEDPTIDSYPITGASPSDVGGAEEIGTPPREDFTIPTFPPTTLPTLPTTTTKAPGTQAKPCKKKTK